MAGAAGVGAPVGKRSSFSIALSSSSGSVVGYCWRYTIYSQCGVGKSSSAGLLGEDDHELKYGLVKEVSCRARGALTV